MELLIQWLNHPIEEASWEDYNLLTGQFPSFRLEDKSYFQEGCTDMRPSHLKTYSRRKRGSGDKDGTSIDQVHLFKLLGIVEQLNNY